MDASDFLDFVRRVALHRWTRTAVAWLAVLSLAVGRGWHAVHVFDTPKPENAAATDFEAASDNCRADGNPGHIFIDFGGQWLFARTLVTGHGKQLYHRQVHWKIANDGYPLSRQSPAAIKYAYPGIVLPTHLKKGDADRDDERLMNTMMCLGDEPAVANPLREPFGAIFAGAIDPNPFAAAAFAKLGSEQITKEVVDDFEKPILGGPLYPPTHPFFYAPLGLISEPQQAYHAFQIASILALFGCGAMIRLMSRGRIWCSVATFVLLIYPGSQPGIDLGQNHCITLFILLSGWALASRGYQFGGGAIWGLLAFKPIWGIAFILAPLLMRRWRFIGGTAVVGFGFVLLTIPFVGVQAWKDWFDIGKYASDLYNRDQNWINLSRDVSGLPKRLMIDFETPRDKIDTTYPNFASNALLAFVAVTTIAIYVYHGHRSRLFGLAAGLLAVVLYVLEKFTFWDRPNVQGFLFYTELLCTVAFLTTVILSFFHKHPRRATGLAAGFLLLGAYLCGYRFMYYDSLLAVVGFAAMLAQPNEVFGGLTGTLQTVRSVPMQGRIRGYFNSPILTLLLLLVISSTYLHWQGAQFTVALGQILVLRKDKDGKAEWKPRQLSVAADWNHANDTALTMVAWLWLALRVLREGRRADAPLPQSFDPFRRESSAEPISGERISDSPTSTA